MTDPNDGLRMTEFLNAAVELLTIQSTADRPDDLQRAVDFVVDFVGPGFHVERFASHGKPSALLYCGDRRPTFRVLLNGHVDVVPASPEQFRPYTDDGRLYARGAQDMKITALAQAHVFRQTAAELPFPLGLQVVADEEIGGRDGTGHQVENGVDAEFALFGESSGLDIVADSKGLVQAKLSARGRSAHGAYPWLGDNALLQIMDTVARLRAVYPMPDQAEWRTTVNVARVSTSNQAANKVPDDAEAWLDIRFPAQDRDLGGRSSAEIADYLQSLCEPGVTAEVLARGAPHHVDHDHPDVRALGEAARSAGYGGRFIYKHGSCDARYLAAKGVAAVAFGIGGDGQHGPDEYAEISTIEPYCQALEGFLALGAANI